VADRQRNGYIRSVAGVQDIQLAVFNVSVNDFAFVCVFVSVDAHVFLFLYIKKAYIENYIGFFVIA
jgi:hypothetical protein